MKRPGFLENALVALAGAVFGTLAFAALAWALPAALAARLLTAGLGLAYLIYLLGRSAERVGRPTVLVLWLLTAAVLWLLAPTLPLYVTAHLVLLSLVRSLYFHQGALGALADLGLAGIGFVAGVGVFLHTGSLLLAIWSLLLVQALFVFIPVRGMPGAAEPGEEDRFQRAHRAAEEAVRKLSALR